MIRREKNNYSMDQFFYMPYTLGPTGDGNHFGPMSSEIKKQLSSHTAKNNIQSSCNYFVRNARLHMLQSLRQHRKQHCL